MPTAVCKAIKKAVVDEVIAIEEGAFVPRFLESFPRKGTVVFICEDKESGEWLEGRAENLKLGREDLAVRVVPPEEMRTKKVLVHLPTGVEKAADFLKLVRMQNKGVDTAKWAVLNETPEGCLILGLDEPSVATLRSLNFKLKVGVGQTVFKLLDRGTAKAEAKAGGNTQNAGEL